MAMVRYAVQRGIEAVDDKGRACRIAMAVIHHENGLIQRLAIDEEKIRFCGEEIIELEVKEAALKEGTYLRGVN